MAEVRLGTVPVLKDARQSEGEVGQTAIVAATLADFSAILLLSLFFSASGGSTGSRLVLVIAFAAYLIYGGLHEFAEASGSDATLGLAAAAGEAAEDLRSCSHNRILVEV